jgi:multidrug resistance efflux pump
VTEATTTQTPPSPDVQRAEAQQFAHEAAQLIGRAEELQRRSEYLTASAELAERRVGLVSKLAQAREHVTRQEHGVTVAHGVLATAQAALEGAEETLRQAVEADEEAKVTLPGPDAQIELLNRRRSAAVVADRYRAPVDQARGAVEHAEAALTAARANVLPVLADIAAVDARASDPVPVAPQANLARLTREWQPRLIAAMGQGRPVASEFSTDEMKVLSMLMSMYFLGFGLDKTAAYQERERLKSKHPMLANLITTFG